MRLMAMIAILALTASAWGTGIARSEVLHDRVYDEEAEVWRPVERRTGEALPAYLVVQSFLRMASYRLDSDSGWDRLLHEMGLAGGGPAEGALRAAVEAARERVFEVPPEALGADPRATPIAFLQAQVERARHDVGILAGIYAVLRLELERSGGLDGLDDRLAALGRSMTVTLVGHPDDPFDVDRAVFEIYDGFDRLVSDALAASHRER